MTLRLRSIMRCASLALPFQIRQCRRSTSATFARLRLQPTRLIGGQAARRLLRVLQPRSDVEPGCDGAGMDHHVDIVGIVERHRRALECRLIKIPGWGVARPDHPGDAAVRRSVLSGRALSENSTGTKGRTRLSLGLGRSRTTHAAIERPRSPCGLSIDPFSCATPRLLRVGRDTYASSICDRIHGSRQALF